MDHTPNYKIINDTDAAGLIALWQKMKNIKVLILNNCSLDALSSKIVFNLVSAFSNQLEFLSMNTNPFSLEIMHIIIDGLAYNKILRYLNLHFPGGTLRNHHGRLEENDHLDLEKLQDICEIFHKKIDIYRQSPIYISWTDIA